MPEPKFLTENIPHEYILLPNVKHAHSGPIFYHVEGESRCQGARNSVEFIV